MEVRMLAAAVWSALLLGAGARGEEPARALYAAGLTPAPVSPAAGPRGLLGADDPLLAALGGARGRNRLAVCGGCRPRPRAAPPGRCLPQRCPAVAWRRRWALVRLACVAGLAVEEIRVMRTANHERTCDVFDQNRMMMEESTRSVVARRVAPLWRTDGFYDTALLGLDLPFDDDEPLLNATAADILLQDIKFWMEKVDEYYTDMEDPQEVFNRNGATFYTLLVTGILPGILFLLFFLFITFGTSTPIKVPYSNEKEGIVTPWMAHKFPTDVKCYPTYGPTGTKIAHCTFQVLLQGPQTIKGFRAKEFVDSTLLNPILEKCIGNSDDRLVVTPDYHTMTDS